MGFDIGGSTALLEFDESTVLGGVDTDTGERAAVRVSLDVPIRDFLMLQRAMVSSGEKDAQMDSLETAYRHFGDVALISWNLKRGAEILSADGAGMLALPFPVANAILGAWVEAVSGGQGNSVAVSANGARSAAQLAETAAP